MEFWPLSQAILSVIFAYKFS